MPLDATYLREHYASLSDEALLSLDRADLVEVAQKIFDEEVERRELNAPKARRATASLAAARRPDLAGEEMESDEEGNPSWLEDAAEVYSRYDSPGANPAPQAVQARDVLEAAGIPCYLEFYEEPETAEDVAGNMRYRWRIMAPGKLSQWATSVLDRDIFNVEFEAQWRNHLELLSDEEVREMEPEVVFCGLFDRIDRVNRAYEEELARRRLDR